MVQQTDFIFNLKDQIEKWAVSKEVYNNDIHQGEDKSKIHKAVIPRIEDLEGQIKDVSAITIDDSLKQNSTNPVQNSVIYNKINSLEAAINNLNTIIRNQKSEAAINNPKDLGNIIGGSGFNNITSNGFYTFTYKSPSSNSQLENLTGFTASEMNNLKGTLLVQNSNQNNNLLQTISFPFVGKEFKRFYKNGQTTDWFLSNTTSPFLINQKLGLQRQNGAEKLSVYEMSDGYTVIWNHSTEANNKTFNTPKNTNYEWINIAKFTNSNGLNIGKSQYVFSNIIGKFDLKITQNEIKLRPTSTTALKISGIINHTYYVPKGKITTT